MEVLCSTKIFLCMIKRTDLYLFAVNWISLNQVLRMTRMYLCTSPGLACGMDLFHTQTQKLLSPITVLAKRDLDGPSRLEQIWP